MTRILIADDHPLFRKGVSEMLHEHPDLRVTAEASDGRQLVRHVQEDSFALVITDIVMPDRNGLEAIHEIKCFHPNLPILILSMHADVEFVVRAMKAGASGYLTKDSAPDELVKAVRKVISGGKYLGAELNHQVAEVLGTGSDVPLHRNLSEREYTVLLRLAAGKSLVNIASELNVSAKTVTTYRSRVLEKLKLSNNAELTLYVLNHRL